MSQVIEMVQLNRTGQETEQLVQNGVPQPGEEKQNDDDTVYLIEQKYLIAKIQATDTLRKKLQSLEERKKYWLINVNRSIRLYYKQAPCNFKFSTIYGLSILFSLLILLFIIMSDLNINMSEFQMIYNNVNSDIIDDIKFVYYNTTCQREFGVEYSTLFQYEWPGTQMSCNCSHQFSNNNPLNIQQFFSQYFTIGKSCTKANLSNGCETVYEQTPKNFSGWNDNQFSEPFILCGKRTSGVNLRTNYTLCESDSTICGSGSFTFCVPNNTRCPITKLGFTLNSTQYEPEVLQNTGNGFYFYFLRNTSSLPIVQLKVTEGDAVCRDNSNNISPNHQDYPLMRVQREVCSLLDEQYTKIDQINEEQFYYANRINYLQQMLPYYYIDSNYNWTLFQKTYILQNCGGNIIEELISNVNSINAHNKLYQKLLITSILYFIFIGIIYNAGQIATYNYYLWPFHLMCLKSRNVCKYTWLTINCVVQGIFFIFIMITFKNFYPLSDFFVQISYNDCFIDSISVSFIRDVNNAMFTVKIYLLLSLFAEGSQVLLAGGLILYEIIQERKVTDKVPLFNQIKGINNQTAVRHQFEANYAIKQIAKLDEKIVELINGKK